MTSRYPADSNVIHLSLIFTEARSLQELSTTQTKDNNEFWVDL